MGSAFNCCRDCIDHGWSSLSVLEPVSAMRWRKCKTLTASRLISVICTVAIACSLGEIASIYPTAGGMFVPQSR
jgi:hypothetical protein